MSARSVGTALPRRAGGVGARCQSSHIWWWDWSATWGCASRARMSLRLPSPLMPPQPGPSPGAAWRRAWGRAGLREISHTALASGDFGADERACICASPSATGRPGSRLHAGLHGPHSGYTGYPRSPLPARNRSAECRASFKLSLIQSRLKPKSYKLPGIVDR
eukprot:scaffold3115_cov335-Prasinococcus_capsulatus_cf.AAC.4